ncbi:MAG: hypothetical protein JNJ54_14855 [Myxococcaceae bacterium]|nr:hypothetical protein [Myxococcaceae bacterium]
MRAFLQRKVQSRRDVNQLPPLGRAQLQRAGRAILGARDLASVVAWCERERAGWCHLAVGEDGQPPEWDAWVLTSGDDGVVFTSGASEPLGLIISQSLVIDVQGARDELARRLQGALDAFGKTGRGWDEPDPQATVRVPPVRFPWPVEGD